MIEGIRGRKGLPRYYLRMNLLVIDLNLDCSNRQIGRVQVDGPGGDQGFDPAHDLTLFSKVEIQAIGGEHVIVIAKTSDAP